MSSNAGRAGMVRTGCKQGLSPELARPYAQSWPCSVSIAASVVSAV